MKVRLSPNTLAPVLGIGAIALLCDSGPVFAQEPPRGAKAAPTDEEIEFAVEQAIWRDPAADSYEITVRVRDGRVRLEGRADSVQEKRIAGFVANGVQGVEHVSNELEVDPPDFRHDNEIRAEIQAALRWDPLINEDSVDVHVDEGRVTLEGEVPSAETRGRAMRIAWTAGVLDVAAEALEIR